MTHRRGTAFALSLALCACGGSGDGGGGGGTTPIHLTNFQVASDILGQATTTGNVANNGAGSGSTNQIGLETPTGHVGNGSVYVADQGNNRILGWDAPPTGLGEPADFVLGQVDFVTGTPGVSATKLDDPSSCWVAGGSLFVADTSNSRVLIFGGPPNATNAPASVALGKPDLTTTGSSTGQAGLNFPEDVCVAAGRIVVADNVNDRVMIWNGVPSSSGAAAQTVVGQPDFVTTSPGTTANKLSSPNGVWTDGTRLVVADTGNHRVLIWTTFPTSNGQAADLVLGQSDFVSNTGGSGAQKFNSPWSVASDGVQLFVADRGNNRVLVFSPFPTTSNAAATGVLGQNSFTNVSANDDDQNGTTDATPTARTLAAPAGVTAVGNRLYVADVGNHRVVVFTGS
jgi:hypothetical protein